VAASIQAPPAGAGSPPEALAHSLNRYFADLQRLSSTKELLRSSLYQQIRPEVERVLGTVVQENPASA
jgi:hypothetical protein